MQIDRNNLPGVLAALPASHPAPDTSDAAGTPATEPGPASGSPQRPASSPALDDLDQAITALLTVDPGTITDTGALETIEHLARQRRRLEAAWLQAIAVADQIDATSAAGIPATLQQHLIAGTGSSPGRAKADIEAARAIHGEPTGELVPNAMAGSGPLAPMGQLLAAGDITAAHVDTGVKTLEQIPQRLSTRENLDTITGFLVDHSPITTPKQIKAMTNRLIRNLEPNTDDHYDADSYLRRSFTMNTDITGMVHGSYQLDPAAGAELMAILNPLTAPHSGQADEYGNTIARDDRSPAQRRADAFGELIHAATTYLGPVNHATPPHTTGDSQEASGTSHGNHGGSARGAGSGVDDSGRHLDVEANINRPGANGTPPTEVHMPGRSQDVTQQPAQIPDLFILSPDNGPEAPLSGNTARQPDSTSAGQPPNKPSESGDKPRQLPGSRAGKLRLTRRQNRVSIVTTMDQIKTVQDRRTGRAKPVNPVDSYCEQVGPIPSGTLARMSCDALFERVVLDANGALLDLGLPTRLASPAQRRAVAIRDGGCIVAGCNRPASWCEIHHIIWYSHDGPTDVGNLGPACPSHHSAIHAGLLEATMIDGIPYVRVTAKGAKTLGTTMPLGSVPHPDRTDWIRNNYFDQLKSADHAARAIIVPDATPQQSAA